MLKIMHCARCPKILESPESHSLAHRPTTLPVKLDRHRFCRQTGCWLAL